MEAGAGAGAAGAGSGGGSLDLMFVKEEVKPLSATPAKSLLSSSLAGRSSAGASRRATPPMSPIKILPQDRRRRHRSFEESKAGRGLPVCSPSGGLTPPPSVALAHRSSVSSGGSTERPRSLMEDRGGFSVAHIISAVVTHTQTTSGVTLTLPKTAPEYQLRIAEDGSGTAIDDDFPELDGTVEIVSVGVPNLLLVEATTDRVVAAISLPAEAIGMRREARAALKALDITVRGLDGREQFVVKVPSALLQ